jgi:hypothetical protein
MQHATIPNSAMGATSLELLGPLVKTAKPFRQFFNK